MKACGHEHVTVEGCDTCYVVKLKKRVDKLLAAEYKRLNRIAMLEAAIRNHKACGGEPADSERLYAVLQEQGDE